MHERKDGIPYPFEYRAANGFSAICEIRVYHHADKTIVVATDLDVGPSVTNNVEVIGTLLRQRGIHFDLFFEHYSENQEMRREEIFDWVFFKWHGTHATYVDWKHGTRQQVEEAIGRKFE